MGVRFFLLSSAMLSTCFLWGCGSPNPVKKQTQVTYSNVTEQPVKTVRFDENSIIPDTSDIQLLAMDEPQKKVKSCSFSSAQRKHTFGYEIDPSRHVTFVASPSFDIWDPSDFKARFGVRFTKSLGGEALKRPCTFGSGYYGIIPYLTNNPDTLSTVTNPMTVKSMVEDRLDEREREREQKRKEQERQGGPVDL